MGGKRTAFSFLLLTIILSLTVPVVAGMWVWHDLEKKSDVEISGRYSPAFFLPAFTIKDASLNWEDKAKLKGGNIRVDYDLLKWITGQGLTVRLSGSALPVSLSQEIAQYSKSPEVIVDRFLAELVFDSQGLKEVKKFVAESSEFQFHFGEGSRNNRINTLLPGNAV